MWWIKFLIGVGITWVGVNVGLILGAIFRVKQTDRELEIIRNARQDETSYNEYQFQTDGDRKADNTASS